MSQEYKIRYLKIIPEGSARNYFHIKLAMGLTPQELKTFFEEKSYQWDDLMENDVSGFIDEVKDLVGEEDLKKLMLYADEKGISPFYSLLCSPDNFISFMNKYENLAIQLFKSQEDVSYLLSRYISLEAKNTILKKVWHSTKYPWLKECLINEMQSSAYVDTSIVLDLLRDHINDPAYLPLLLPLLKNYGQDDDAVKLCIQKCHNEVGFWYRLKLFFNGYFKLALNWNKIANQVTVAPWSEVSPAQSADREGGLGVVERRGHANSSLEERARNRPK